MTPKKIQKLSYEKAVKLEKLIDEVEKRISISSSELTKIMLKRFLDKLNTEQGKVIQQFNQRTLTLFNQAFKFYREKVLSKMVGSIVSDIDNILADNHNFYKKTVNGFNIDKADMKRIVNRRLGISDDGTLLKQGYMSGLLDDTAIRSNVQKYVLKEMFKSTGVEAFRRGIKTFIEGEPNKYGAFQRHYRTFSFDVYAQLNSFASGLYAQRLGMTHFIYNGGLIKTSRKFCIERNGKVYSTEEAEDWKNDPDLVAIDNSETYNWLIDRGGFNCRHTTDFIADEVAVILRPDLK